VVAHGPHRRHRSLAGPRASARWLGDEVVDRLTDAQAGRLLGRLLAAAMRELERCDQIAGQLEIDAA
jgi:hypothetical protein